ncbi:unnamed protein product [Linum trigynum]|uniref:Uncharacterized protein n=1 Tax=Linum trigynum TaxID=586398 RepID=A0AAV2FAQ3_9ROSI
MIISLVPPFGDGGSEEDTAIGGELTYGVRKTRSSPELAGRGSLNLHHLVTSLLLKVEACPEFHLLGQVLRLKFLISSNPQTGSSG